MALPTTGQLSLKDIGVEQGITAGNQASMRSMASTAGYSTPDTVSEFYGYSAGDNITVAWGSLSTPSVTTTSFDQYRTVNLTGISGSTIRPYITVGTTAGSSYTISFYWSINSTSSWTFFSSRSSTGTSSYYIPTTVYVGSGDTLRVRILISRSPFASCSYTLSLSSSLYQVGSGTVSSYGSGGILGWTGTF